MYIEYISLAMDYVYFPFIEANSITEIKCYLLTVLNPIKLIICNKYLSSNKRPSSVQDVQLFFLNRLYKINKFQSLGETDNISS